MIMDELIGLDTITPDVRIKLCKTKAALHLDANTPADRKAALKAAQMAIKLTEEAELEDDARAIWLAGRALEQQGKTKQAAKYFQQALRLMPTNQKYVDSFNNLLSGARIDRNYATLPTATRIKPPKAVHVDSTPEPPEPPAPQKELVEKGIPEEWKVIDLSDIAYEMTLLREAILSAIEVSCNLTRWMSSLISDESLPIFMQDGKVDKEEE
eukprot:SAG31_NODE_12712_length_922_cov_0.935601_2_plen_211_part_01